MKILLLARYGVQGASSRLRLFIYLQVLAASGVECGVSSLIDDVLLLGKYKQGRFSFWDLLIAYWRRIKILTGRKQFDLVWIEKEALPWFPVSLERFLLRGTPYVLDFDDAVFHNYDLHYSSWVRFFWGQRISRLMEGAKLVIVGNNYLARWAKKSGAQRIEIIPTIIDLARYFPKPENSLIHKPKIVWIGSPSTVKYLLDLAEPLMVLAKRQSFTLRVIGGGVLVMPGVDIEIVPWSVDTEATAIAECDIGIMPLRDTPWEQGKCAYKLIQYMACGLPTVASPVGANLDVVIKGETGFFADKPSAWIEILESLLRDTSLRLRLGQAGRLRVETEYCLQQTAPKLVRLLSVAGGR